MNSFSDMSGTPGVSRVLHVRNIPSDSSADLIAYVSRFGHATGALYMSKFNQALIEMENVAQATTIINFAHQEPLMVRGHEVQFGYSKSQHINQHSPAKPSSAPGSPAQPAIGANHILLVTIHNPVYNVTIDMLYSIFAHYGPVQRIVIFQKHSLQALIEFDSIQAAVAAKSALDGKDIYAGACTLRIEFSKADKLNVTVNNDKTRDFTNPSLPTSAAPPPPAAAAASASASPAALHPLAFGLAPMHGAALPATVLDFYRTHLPYAAAAAAAVADTTSRSVLIVYGLDENVMTCDRIFNLFSLYGNVAKIKLLSNKKGTALVQMSDNNSADLALQHLNHIQIFGSALQVQHSKHSYIADSRATGEDDANANPTCKDYSNSPLNRFTKTNTSAYKHIYKPSSTLYFSNAPKDYTEQHIAQLFQSMNANVPHAVKIFATPQGPNDPPKERKIGLLEFGDVVGATEGLAIVNNTKVNGFTLRLSFTLNSIHPSSPAN